MHPAVRREKAVLALADMVRGGVSRQNPPAAKAHRQHRQKNGPGPGRREGCCGCTLRTNQVRVRTEQGIAKSSHILGWKEHRYIPR